MAHIKRKFLTIEEKVEVIKCSEKFKLSSRQLADKFLIGKTQAAEIIKKKEEILKKVCEHRDNKRKKNFPNVTSAALDNIVFDWFSKARNKNLPISGVLLKEKALEVAKQLELPTFKASNGWLEKFCKRWQISFKSICGEAGQVKEEDVAEWKNKLCDIIKEYPPENIFNADETGLFFRALPTKTFAFKNENCTGGKASKDRLTILFCASMTGEKEIPLVIGKSKKPRCFKGAHIDKLPIEWKFNKKAWMTRDIMSEWLMKFDRKMQRQKRNVLLFLDNATSHPQITLNNIKLVFFPPNMTSHCQPLDQGIIKAFKCYYRKYIVRRLLSTIDNLQNTDELEKSINIVNALIWISTAWKNVKEQIINNCFTKAGFGLNKSEHNKDLNEEYDSEDEIPLSEFILENTEISFTEYVEIDRDLSTESSEVSIEKCTQEFLEECKSDASDNESDNEETIHTEVIDIKDAHKKLKDLQNFFYISEDIIASKKIIDIIGHVENVILKKIISAKKQTTIDNFFKPV